MRYLVQCNRDDEGKWHCAGFEYSPVFLFHASNDESAWSLAKSFATLPCHGKLGVEKLIRWPKRAPMRLVKKSDSKRLTKADVNLFRSVTIKDILP